MALMLALQDFATTATAEVAPSPETLPGYAAGFAAGEAACLAAQANLDAAAVQALEDIAFTFAEARQTVLQSLAPLFHALGDLIIPEAVEPAFRVRLVQVLLDAATHDAQAPARLFVHPDAVTPLQELMSRMQMHDVTVSASPDQGQRTALIRHGATETSLDVAAISDQIKSILAAFFETTEDQSHHG